jgi:hypothetical protein
MFLLGAMLMKCLSLIRKQQYSLLRSLINSEKFIVKSFAESDIHPKPTQANIFPCFNKYKKIFSISTSPPPAVGQLACIPSAN